jgi:hypothetical protein
MNRLIRQEFLLVPVFKMTSPVSGSDERLSGDEIIDLRGWKTDRVAVPFLLALFSPILITFHYGVGRLTIFFFFLWLDVGFHPPSIYFGSISPYFLQTLLISIPYLLLGMISTWQLHRLSTRRSSPRRVLIVISLAAAVWISFYLMAIVFGLLHGVHSTIGPLPLPIPSVVAILSRTRIMELNRRIESLEKQDAGLV